VKRSLWEESYSKVLGLPVILMNWVIPGYGNRGGLVAPALSVDRGGGFASVGAAASLLEEWSLGSGHWKHTHVDLAKCPARSSRSAFGILLYTMCTQPAPRRRIIADHTSLPPPPTSHPRASTAASPPTTPSPAPSSSPSSPAAHPKYPYPPPPASDTRPDPHSQSSSPPYSRAYNPPAPRATQTADPAPPSCASSRGDGASACTAGARSPGLRPVGCGIVGRRSGCWSRL